MILDKKWNITIKMIGLACILVTIWYIATYSYEKGRFDECINNNGFLLRDNNNLKCYNESYIESKGLIINKEHKTLETKPTWSNGSLWWGLQNGTS